MTNRGVKAGLVWAGAVTFLILSLTGAFASDDGLAGLMAICGAQIEDARAETDKVAAKLASLKQRLEQSPLKSSDPSKEQPPKPALTRIVASGEQDVARSRTYVDQAQKAYGDAQRAIRGGDKASARQALNNVVIAIATADHI